MTRAPSYVCATSLFFATPSFSSMPMTWDARAFPVLAHVTSLREINLSTGVPKQKRNTILNTMWSHINFILTILSRSLFSFSSPWHCGTGGGVPPNI
uniref:Putative secreted protein n=1 Tax=Anopheles darlingi TaxID=43151 RepID=A0A2M4DHL3_ANODA